MQKIDSSSKNHINYSAIEGYMTTTIQVNDDTMQFLKLLREQYKAVTYDELLNILIKKAMRPSKSLAGAGGKLSMKEILKGLRDKSDRY